jgi:hypothetical protein
MQSHGAAAGTQSDFADSRRDILQGYPASDILPGYPERISCRVYRYPMRITGYPHRISC